MLRSAWQMSMALAQVALFCGQASGICAGTTSFCAKLPDRDDKNSAIFVGTVVQVRGAVIRFHVLETFLTAALDEFELIVTSDLYIGNVPQDGLAFAQGQTWLVEARRREVNQQWTTSTCQRTKKAQIAEEDLRVLRAWVAGQQLPAEVSGEVWDPVNAKNIPNVQVTLVGGAQSLSALSDEHGQFMFSDLVPGIYGMVALLPAGAVRQELDLTHAWCVRTAFLWQ